MARHLSFRTAHRWVSAAFLVTVVIAVVSELVGGPVWMAYLAVPPVIGLLITGTYLLLRPYVARRRPAHRAVA